MKHIFVVNPAAGKGRAEKEYLPKIQQAVKKEGVSYEIHRTINIGEGETYVRRLLTERKDPAEIYRFYACGGDGTLNEVVNAIMDYPPSLTAKQKQNLLYPLGFKEIFLVVQSIKM